MKKRVFVSILKEIRRNIEDWTEEEFDERMKLGFISFRKFLPPVEGPWNNMTRQDIQIQILES